jgi:predicted RNA-binding protein with PUA-like domain
MAYWLMKSEPGSWSWDQQVKSGAQGEAWSGVRNHQAKANLMKMKKGDRAFFYHSGEDKAVAGIVEVLREHYPDPTAKKGEPWVVVDIKAVAPAARPVTLAAVKAASPADLVLRFLAERLDFYTRLSTFNTFGRGLTRRIAGNLRFAAPDN